MFSRGRARVAPGRTFSPDGPRSLFGSLFVFCSFLLSFRFFVGALPLSLFPLSLLTLSAFQSQSRLTKGEAPKGFEKTVPLVSLLSVFSTSATCPIDPQDTGETQYKLDSFWTLTLPSRRPEVERDACFGIRLFQPYKPYILFDALSVPIPIDQRVELIIGAMFVEQRLPSP